MPESPADSVKRTRCRLRDSRPPRRRLAFQECGPRSEPFAGSAQPAPTKLGEVCALIRVVEALEIPQP
jgi:hypothetical protein